MICVLADTAKKCRTPNENLLIQDKTHAICKHGMSHEDHLPLLVTQWGALDIIIVSLPGLCPAFEIGIEDVESFILKQLQDKGMGSCLVQPSHRWSTR